MTNTDAYDRILESGISDTELEDKVLTALEKQIPTLPKIKYSDNYRVMFCRRCNAKLSGQRRSYCSHCGQRVRYQ